MSSTVSGKALAAGIVSSLKWNICRLPMTGGYRLAADNNLKSDIIYSSEPNPDKPEPNRKVGVR
jgi:hypothetical protein